eukprot:GFUD01001571.1.p1 GENE.GFUD01001571.1~~GFUD01001571.1.p1  ORF type:complete len:397 (+),score=102.82 GFUD01001571.1:352-1542(+)
MVWRWTRATRGCCSCVVLLCILASFLFVFFTDKESSVRDGSEIRWQNRRLAKGEPSGEDASDSKIKLQNKTRTTTEENKQNSDISKHQIVEIGPLLKSTPSDTRTEIKNISERLDLYKERKQMIQTTCNKYGLGKHNKDLEKSEISEYQKMEASFPWPPEKSLMYQNTWNLLYCWIHKVASSSWSKVFFYLKGKDVPASRLHEAAQHFSLSSSNTKLDTSISNSLVFTIVRHPFERLVSAYRDKFELAKKYAYVYSMYTSKILSLASPLEVRHTRRPTFSEFVDYLLRVPVVQFNDHWVPYWLHCHVCEMEYDIIGKMETIAEDMDFIAEESGLAAANISLPWANRKSSGDKVSLDYFQGLSLAQVKGLYAIYRPDFEMFGYQAEAYFLLFGQKVP